MSSSQITLVAFAGGTLICDIGAWIGLHLGWPLILIMAGYQVVVGLLFARAGFRMSTVASSWAAATSLMFILLAETDDGPSIAVGAASLLFGSLAFTLWFGVSLTLKFLLAEFQRGRRNSAS